LVESATPVHFGHIAWLDVVVPANRALRLAIDMNLRKAEDLIRAGVVAQVDLDVHGWIKFVTTLESLYQHCDPQRLPEDMERRDGLRSGDNYGDDYRQT